MITPICEPDTRSSIALCNMFKSWPSTSCTLNPNPENLFPKGFTLITSSVLVINFTVNAVSGPALIFFPRANITSVGSNVTFQVMAEEVTNLTAAQFNISFDPSKLEILSVTQGAMLQISGESIFDVDYDNATGSVSVITAALGGSQPSVDGTGVLLELELKVNAAGTSTLEFDGTELFRDPDNNDITIAQMVNGIVVVE